MNPILCQRCGADMKEGQTLCEYCGTSYERPKPISMIRGLPNYAETESGFNASRGRRPEDSTRPNPSLAPRGEARAQYILIQRLVNPKSSKIPVMEAGLKLYSGLFDLRNHKGRLGED